MKNLLKHSSLFEDFRPFSGGI